MLLLPDYYTPDEQEAKSTKYVEHLRVVKLESGRFALFGAFSNSNGLPLLGINTWEELGQVARDYTPERPTLPPASVASKQRSRVTTPSPSNLLDLI